MGTYADGIRIPDGKLHSCENCGSMHYAGGWGGIGTSGRFCRRRCAQQWSSKQRYKNMTREEINRRISVINTGKKYPNRKRWAMSPEGKTNISKASKAMWAKRKALCQEKMISPADEQPQSLGATAT